ncbi:hypothetical protein AAF712_015567 [Marasmius tenuissimus]|uniref:Uncharacterized protein n=1 Tax=Marasmius tenuissimus TaxID=585030 RepID=A0ABR2ZAG8_9AGAR
MSGSMITPFTQQTIDFNLRYCMKVYHPVIHDPLGQEHSATDPSASTSDRSGDFDIALVDVKHEFTTSDHGPNNRQRTGARGGEIERDHIHVDQGLRHDNYGQKIDETSIEQQPNSSCYTPSNLSSTNSPSETPKASFRSQNIRSHGISRHVATSDNHSVFEWNPIAWNPGTVHFNHNPSNFTMEGQDSPYTNASKYTIETTTKKSIRNSAYADPIIYIIDTTAISDGYRSQTMALPSMTPNDLPIISLTRSTGDDISRPFDEIVDRQSGPSEKKHKGLLHYKPPRTRR